MRPLCPRCALPLPACLCRWVTPTANRIPLLVLQHPDEQHQAKGSVRLLRLSLSDCRCLVGTRFDPAGLAAALRPPAASPTAAPLLLFPGGDWAGAQTQAPPPGQTAAAAGPPGLAAAGGPLVLLDGTWRQARQLLRDHPALQALPRWSLPAPPPSRYTIRRAHRPAQRSSLESACLALGLLEGRPAHYDPLLAAFDGWVAGIAARQARGSTSPA